MKKNVNFFLLISLIILGCNKKNNKTSNLGNVFMNLKLLDTIYKTDRVKGQFIFFNNFNDTLQIDHPKDERYLRAYIYMSKNHVENSEFPEHLSDTFAGYSTKLRDTVKFDFWMKKSDKKGSFYFKMKVLDQTFLHSYDSVRERYIELPFFCEKQIFIK